MLVSDDRTTRRMTAVRFSYSLLVRSAEKDFFVHFCFTRGHPRVPLSHLFLTRAVIYIRVYVYSYFSLHIYRQRDSVVVTSVSQITERSHVLMLFVIEASKEVCLDVLPTPDVLTCHCPVVILRAGLLINMKREKREALSFLLFAGGLFVSRILADVDTNTAPTSASSHDGSVARMESQQGLLLSSGTGSGGAAGSSQNNFNVYPLPPEQQVYLCRRRALYTLISLCTACPGVLSQYLPMMLQHVQGRLQTHQAQVKKKREPLHLSLHCQLSCCFTSVLSTRDRRGRRTLLRSFSSFKPMST